MKNAIAVSRVQKVRLKYSSSSCACSLSCNLKKLLCRGVAIYFDTCVGSNNDSFFIVASFSLRIKHILGFEDSSVTGQNYEQTSNLKLKHRLSRFRIEQLPFTFDIETRLKSYYRMLGHSSADKLLSFNCCSVKNDYNLSLQKVELQQCQKLLQPQFAKRTQSH